MQEKDMYKYQFSEQKSILYAETKNKFAFKYTRCTLYSTYSHHMKPI